MFAGRSTTYAWDILVHGLVSNLHFFKMCNLDGTSMTFTTYFLAFQGTLSINLACENTLPCGCHIHWSAADGPGSWEMSLTYGRLWEYSII